MVQQDTHGAGGRSSGRTRAGLARLAFARLVGTALLAVAVVASGLGTAAAAPAPERSSLGRLAGPLQRALSGDAASAERRAPLDRAALAREAEESDEGVYLGLSPSCVRSGKKAAPRAEVYADRRTTLDWVLTGTKVRVKGSVTTRRADVARLRLPKLARGGYRITMTERAGKKRVVDTRFDVLACVTAKASCHAVRLSNPKGNPAADVSYGTPTGDDFSVRLGPGRAKTVRVDERRVDVYAFGAAEESDADLGRLSVTVPVACRAKPATPSQNAVETSAVVGCGSAGTPADVILGWLAQRSLKQRTWEVLDTAGHVVVHGSYANGREQVLRLGPGRYTYLSHANRNAKPFERRAFSVLGCITVEPACRSLRLTNPNDVAVEAVVIDPALLDDDDVDLGDDADDEQVSDATLKPRGTADVAWTRPTATYLALAADLDEQTRFIGLASPFPVDGELSSLPQIEVPQDC